LFYLLDYVDVGVQLADDDSIAAVFNIVYNDRGMVDSRVSDYMEPCCKLSFLLCICWPISG